MHFPDFTPWANEFVRTVSIDFYSEELRKAYLKRLWGGGKVELKSSTNLYFISISGYSQHQANIYFPN